MIRAGRVVDDFSITLEFPSVDHLSTLTVVICAIESPSDYSHNSRWKAIRHHGAGAFRSTFLCFSSRRDRRVCVGIQSRKMSSEKILSAIQHARTRTSRNRLRPDRDSLFPSHCRPSRRVVRPLESVKYIIFGCTCDCCHRVLVAHK